MHQMAAAKRLAAPPGEGITYPANDVMAPASLGHPAGIGEGESRAST